MKDELALLDKKIVDLILSRYKLLRQNGRQNIQETKRISKSKRDVISKMKSVLSAYDNIGEIMKVGMITPEKISEPRYNVKDNLEYIREIHSKLDKKIIINTLEFNLIQRKDDLEYFKNIQREITFGVFDEKSLNKLLDSIFMFHPKKSINVIGDQDIVNNENELTSEYYQEIHKAKYHELAYLLVKRGMDEIIKNLDSKEDKLIIENFLYTVNIVKRLSYRTDIKTSPQTED